MFTSIPLVCRDDVACGIKVPDVKQNKISTEDVLLLPLQQMSGLVGVCLQPVFFARLMGSSLMRACTPGPVLPHVDKARERRE